MGGVPCLGRSVPSTARRPRQPSRCCACATYARKVGHLCSFAPARSCANVYALDACCSRSRVHCRRIRQRSACSSIHSRSVPASAPHQSKRLRSLKYTPHIAGPEHPAVLQPTRALTQLPQHNLSFCRLSTNCDSAAVFVKLDRSTFGTECELLRSLFFACSCAASHSTVFFACSCAASHSSSLSLFVSL